MINLNFRDTRPIYEQIMDGFRRLIVTGAIPPDEKLPSVRDLAAQLAINPNTIQRAYRELEAEGYIYSVAGRGSFASGETEAQDNRRKTLFDELNGLVTELFFLGVSKNELLSRIEDISIGTERKDL